MSKGVMEDRAIDIQIAEFMGWANCGIEYGELRGSPPEWERLGHTDRSLPVPHYSVSMSDAWLVVDKLRADGLFFDIGDKPSDPNDLTSSRVWNVFIDRIIRGPDADTAPLAICGAVKMLLALPHLDRHLRGGER